MKVSAAVAAYIAHKQSLGFLFSTQASDLRAFARDMGDTELHLIQSDAVLRSLDRPKISTPTWRSRYARIDKFFRYWRLMGLIDTLPMPPPRGIVRSTFFPYVFSKAEIQSLLAGTQTLNEPSAVTVPAETLRVFLLFLYATGARPSEAFNLLDEDVNISGRSITLRWTGRSAPRILPIGSDLRRVLWRYRQWRSVNLSHGEAFFTRINGRPLHSEIANRRLARLLEHTGIKRRDQPNFTLRLYDFRSTFAVHRITEWIHEGKDLNRLLPALAAYLGQADLTATDKFLALTPSRFKKELDKLSPEQGGRWVEKSEAMQVIQAIEAGAVSASG